MTQFIPIKSKRIQPHNKSVFLSGKKDTTLECSLCLFFNSSNPGVNDQEIYFSRNSSKKFFNQQDFTATKSSKKSLKSSINSNQFLTKTVNQTLKPKNDKILQAEQKMPSSLSTMTRDVSKILSKTSCSDPGFNFIRKQSTFYSMASSSKNIQFPNGCQNLNFSLHKIQFQNHFSNQNEQFRQIPLIESVNKRYNSEEIVCGLSFVHRAKHDFDSDNANFNKLSHLTTFSRNMTSLPISPVKQHVIQEESEQSVLNSQNPITDRQELVLSKKLTEFKQPPILNKKVSENLSELFKTPFSKGSLQKLKQKALQESLPQQAVPQITIHKQSSIKKQNDEMDFLEISFHEDEDIQQMKEKQKTISSHKNDEQTHKTKIISTSSQYKQHHELQQQEEQNNEQVLQSQIHSNSSQNEKTQCIERNMVTAQKLQKVHPSPFGRYSVQVPKSRKFSTMKVRRTISMKDQEDSSEQETSEVIYGFRQTHKLEVIEDIAEDMMDSYMTRNFQRVQASTLSGLRGF